MIRKRISLIGAGLAATLCMACTPKAPEPADPVAPVPESSATVDSPHGEDLTPTPDAAAGIE